MFVVLFDFSTSFRPISTIDFSISPNLPAYCPKKARGLPSSDFAANLKIYPNCRAVPRCAAKLMGDVPAGPGLVHNGPWGKIRRPGEHLDRTRQICNDSRESHCQPRGCSMDFTLSPEQQGVQEKAQGLARDVKDLSARLDREAQFPREILQLWAKEGMFGLALPREYGGQGLDYVAYVLAQMELAQACPASAPPRRLPQKPRKELSWPRRN